MNDKQLRRAGLDYNQYSRVETWDDWKHFNAVHSGRVVSFSTRNKIIYSEFKFQEDDVLLFGSETRGLPDWLREEIPDSQRLTIPMQNQSRSLNLSNSVAVVVYEAWRQQGFQISKG